MHTSAGKFDIIFGCLSFSQLGLLKNVSASNNGIILFSWLLYVIFAICTFLNIQFFQEIL